MALSIAESQLGLTSELRTRYHKLADTFGAKLPDDSNIWLETPNMEVPGLFLHVSKSPVSVDVPEWIKGVSKSGEEFDYLIDNKMHKLKDVLIVQEWPTVSLNKESDVMKRILEEGGEVQFRFCRDSGFHLFKNYKLAIGDKELQYDDRDALLYFQTETTDREYYEHALANEKWFTEWTSDSIPAHSTFTPTCFGFERSEALAIPIMYTSFPITISLGIRPFHNLIQVRYRTGKDEPWKNVSSSDIEAELFKYGTEPKPPQLLVTYTQHSEEQINKIFATKKTYVLPCRLFRHQDVPNVRTDDATITPNQKDNVFKHYIAVLNDDALKLNQYNNFTDNTTDQSVGWSPYKSITIHYPGGHKIELPHDVITGHNVRMYCHGRPSIRGIGVIGYNNERLPTAVDSTHIPNEKFVINLGNTNILELSKKVGFGSKSESSRSSYTVLFRTVYLGELKFEPTGEKDGNGKAIYKVTLTQ